MRLYTAILSVALCVFLSSCGGGGGSSIAPTIPAQTQSAGNVKVTLSSSIQSAALPTAGGFAGTIVFPAVTGTATVEMTASTTAPSGILAAARRPQSGTLSEFYYVNLMPSQTVTLPALPSITLTIPSMYSSLGKQFYYGLQVPAPAGVAQQYRTEGPGVVSGTSVSFAASSEPFTLTAGKKVTFVFYAVSSNNVSAEKLLYVANSGNNSITAYSLSAQGDVAPVRTIIGAKTGLSNPQAIASDADGNVVVANKVSNDVTRIETFNDAASGNSAPIHSFLASALDYEFASMTIDRQNASIYMVLADGINVFSPSGQLLRVLSSLNWGYNLSYIQGIALDTRDRLIVAGASFDRDNINCVYNVYAPEVASGVPPLYSLGRASCSFGIPQTAAYARNVDRVVSLGSDDGSGQPTVVFDQENIADAPVVRHGQFVLPMHASNSVDVLTVDDTGNKVFVVNPTLNQVSSVMGDATTFTQGPTIQGPHTGLAGPTSMTIALP